MNLDTSFHTFCRVLWQTSPDPVSQYVSDSGRPVAEDEEELAITPFYHREFQRKCLRVMFLLSRRETTVPWERGVINLPSQKVTAWIHSAGVIHIHRLKLSMRLSESGLYPPQQMPTCSGEKHPRLRSTSTYKVSRRTERRTVRWNHKNLQRNRTPWATPEKTTKSQTWPAKASFTASTGIL